MGQTFQDILGIGSVIAAPFTAGTSLAWLPGILGAGAGILGGIDQQNASNQASSAANAAYGNEESALGGDEALAKQLAQGPSFQSLLNAQQGGIQTLKSQAGGIANEGALIKQLYGGDVTNALQASIGQRDTNLMDAGSLLTSAASGYGGIGGNYQRVAQSAPNPWTNVLGSVYGAVNQTGSNPGLYPAGSGTATINTDYSPVDPGGNYNPVPGGNVLPGSQ